MEINPETLEIEIVDVEAIEGGVQVFARAWNDGEQIGFGADGTVDIERFRIFNPPVLVEDPNGTITNAGVNCDGEPYTHRYREDETEATLQLLSHTISVMKNVHNSGNIISGKTGNTTSTFNPAAGNTTAYDGLARIQGANTTFSTLNNQTTSTQAFPTETSTTGTRTIASTTTNQFSQIGRGVFGFVTSMIGSDTISSATLSLYGSSKLTGLGNVDFCVVTMTPNSESNMTGTEYNYSRYGTTQLAAAINSASFSTTGYNDFALNASGLAHINKSGNTFFGTEDSWALADSFSGSWVSNANTQMIVFHADETGTSKDPKLVVEHAAAASTTPLRMLMGMGT